MARPRLIDDGLEIRSHLFERDSTEGVVDPERQNQDIDLFPAKKRRQPAEAVGGGIAALAGVNDSELIIRAPHFFGDKAG